MLKWSIIKILGGWLFSVTYQLFARYIGYEPADLTVHPPPQNNRGWVHFFRIGV